MGDYVPAEEKTSITESLSKYKDTAKGDSKEDMDKAVEELTELYRKTIAWEAEKRNKEMPAGEPTDETVVDVEASETK